MYNELKNEGIIFLLTSRINQDALENTFSSLRYMGGNNCHPSAVECINRIREGLKHEHFSLFLYLCCYSLTD